MGTPLPQVPVETCIPCRRPPYDQKAGPACAGCPAFKNTHYFPFSDGPEVPDLVILGDAPVAPRLSLIGGRELVSADIFHQAFKDDGGKVLRNAVTDVGLQADFQGLTARYVYAVKCATERPNKTVLTSCQGYLRAELGRLAASRRIAGYSTNLVILACGVNALHALGVPVKSEGESLGRVFENVVVGEVLVDVIATRSIATYAAGVGKYPTLLADVERAARVARSKPVQQTPRAELERGYVYPKTIAEVREVVQMIRAYAGEGYAPVDWYVAADTETNTLHMNYSWAKAITASFAWDDGKATAITLWHPQAPYDPEEAWRYVVRLVDSGKPLIWHGGKFDYKVFWKHGYPLRAVGNTKWDTLLAEHVLEEDKKGEYSLKPLVKRFLPAYAGYEDRLKELLERDDAEGVLLQVNRTKAVKLPQAVSDAFALARERKWVSSAKFRADTLKKLIETGRFKKTELSPEDLDTLRLLVAAQEAGEFSGRAQAQAAKERKRKGGFERIPLDELLFYACVDADVTRRLAIIQSHRMRAEDEQIRQWREMVAAQLAAQPPDPGGPRHVVRDPCPREDRQHAIVREFKLPLQAEIAKIEYRGVRIDRDYLEDGKGKLDGVLAAMDQEIFKICGESFGINQRKKLASFLFEGGAGFLHPDPEHAEEIVRQNPTEVRYVNGRMTYVPHHFTATGQFQTSADVLKSLVSRYQCPLANLLLARAKADKARNSFFENADILSAMFEDLKLHGGYNLAGTATDRLSSSSGVDGVGWNWQNIPKGLLGALRNTRGDLVIGADGKPVFEGVNCKKLVIPYDSSMCIGNADAKGAEVTVFGSYADDAALIQALIDGMDPHCFFASEALNPARVGAGLTGNARRLALEKAGVDDDHAWSYDDFKNREEMREKGVGKLIKDGGIGDPKKRATWEFPDLVDYADRLDKLRDNIKRLVFGMLFGAGVRKIAEIAGISLELAEKIKALLFERFPSIKTYMDETKWELNMFGLVETVHGGRRRFPIDTSRAPKSLLARAQRQGINVKIQRTNSQLVLLVLCWIAEVLERDMGGAVLLTVHDSIGFQVPKKYAHQMPDLFKKYGTDRIAELNKHWLKSPYRWDLKLGPSYGEQSNVPKYLKSIPEDTWETPRTFVPESVMTRQLDGYTEEEVFEDLREPDEYEMPKKTPPKKAA